MSSWWERATTEQRIAQIKGGIECGMNSRSMATNCGTAAHTLLSFAHHHGISIPTVFPSGERARINSIRLSARQRKVGQHEYGDVFELFGEREGRSEIFSFEGV